MAPKAPTPKAPKAPPTPPSSEDDTPSTEDRPQHPHGGHVRRPMSARQVAKRLGRPHSTVLKWLTSGRLRGSYDLTEGWTVDEQSLDELMDELEAGDTPPDPVAEKLESMANAVVEATKATARLTELLTKPLDMLLRYNEQALENSRKRIADLEDRMAKMFDSHQEALDRGTERRIAIESAERTDKRIGEAFDWLKEEAPKVLGYGEMMKHMRKAASYFGKMSAQDAEDFAAGVEAEEGPEVGESLRELFAKMRDLAKEAAEKRPKPPADAPKAEEPKTEPTEAHKP